MKIEQKTSVLWLIKHKYFSWDTRYASFDVHSLEMNLLDCANIGPKVHLLKFLTSLCLWPNNLVAKIWNVPLSKGVFHSLFIIFSNLDLKTLKIEQETFVLWLIKHKYFFWNNWYASLDVHSYK